TGTLGKPTVLTGPLAISAVTAAPGAISPNGDGVAETTAIAYTTTAAATVTATLLDANGVQLGTIGAPARVGGGDHTPDFDGLGQPDGIYTIVLTAVDTVGTSVTGQVQVAITRTLAAVSLEPAVLTPNGDGAGDMLTVRFQLSAPATVRLRILRDGNWVATP